jgi:hypothetical protein
MEFSAVNLNKDIIIGTISTCNQDTNQQPFSQSLNLQTMATPEPNKPRQQYSYVIVFT